MMLTRRRMMTASVATGWPAPFIRPASAATRRVTLAAPGGLFQQYFETHISSLFRRLNPTLDIIYVPVTSPTQALAMLRTHRVAPQLDVAMLDIPTSQLAAEEKLVEPLTRQAVPVLADLAPTAFVEGLAAPITMQDSLVLLYAPDRVKPPPTGWKTLWDGAADRRIAIPSPPHPAGIAFVLIANRLFGGVDPLRSLASGINAIAQIAPRVASWDPRPTAYDSIIDGQAALSVGWNAWGRMFSQRFQGRVTVAIPEEGSVFSPHICNLVKDASQTEAATTLIAFMLGVEGQKALAELMFLAPVNTNVRLTPAGQAGIVATPAQLARMMQVDWGAIAGIRDSITDQWRQRIMRVGLAR